MGDVVPFPQPDKTCCPTCGQEMPSGFHMSLDLPVRWLGKVRSVRTKSVDILVVCSCGDKFVLTVHNKDVS